MEESEEVVGEVNPHIGSRFVSIEFGIMPTSFDEASADLDYLCKKMSRLIDEGPIKNFEEIKKLLTTIKLLQKAMLAYATIDFSPDDSSAPIRFQFLNDAAIHMRVHQCLKSVVV